MIELCIITAILGQDAFWLMDHLSDGTVEALRRRWHQLACELCWPCVYCGAITSAHAPCEWRTLYN